MATVNDKIALAAKAKARYVEKLKSDSNVKEKFSRLKTLGSFLIDLYKKRKINEFAEKINNIDDIDFGVPNSGTAINNILSTIESLFLQCLQNRKEFRASFYFASTGGWTLQYFPKKLKYKKNEDFKLQIFFTFVASDNFD